MKQLNIGILGGKLGETTPSFPYRKWMDTIDSKYINNGFILNEVALVSSIEHKYINTNVTYITRIDEKLLQKNDINFLVGINLLNAWHNSKSQYNKWYKIMKNPKNKIYPTIKEQLFLYNKGDYLKYYESKGIPIAPTFLIKKNRNYKNVFKRIKEERWKNFIIKPDFAFANIEIERFSINDKNLEEKLNKYLIKTNSFPGLICQEEIIGFRNHWEVKTYWINGVYKYNVAIKAWPHPETFGVVNTKIINQLKKLGKKVYNYYPKPIINGKSIKPLFLRIDFGCCQGNSNDTSKYFLNEIEYAGCGKFTDIKNVFHYWPDAYYNKAYEIINN